MACYRTTATISCAVTRVERAEPSIQGIFDVRLDSTNEMAAVDEATCELAWRCYGPHVAAACGWIARSERPTGGSAAQYTPLVGWSRAYPETTGYIIPTLIDASRRLRVKDHGARAIRFGEWLRGIQNPDGSWNAGLYPSRSDRPSVFNTGQILTGLVSLWRNTGDDRWIDSARRGARWLEVGMGSDGLWRGGDYRASSTPSYYTHVLWPLLEVATEADLSCVRDAAIRGVRTIVSRVQTNGAFSGWGFGDSTPAFTHTMAYTIRGIQGCGAILEDEQMLDAVVPAIERLGRLAEMRAGRLPGAFDAQWRPVGRFVCLTGSAQVAHCLLIHESRDRDLRLVSAAARMLDVVCNSQALQSPIGGIRGGVAGSSPFWAPYMRCRYPNWAAKYLCDGISALCDRLNSPT